MRWWPWRRRREPAQPSEDADAAVSQVQRAQVDTDRLIAHIETVTSRAHEAANRADQVRAHNHFADAVRASMRRAQQS